MRNPFTAKNVLIALILTITVSFGWFTVIEPRLWAYKAPNFTQSWSDYTSEDSYEEWYSDETCDENGACTSSGIQKISLVSLSNEENSLDLGGYWSENFYDETDFSFWGFELGYDDESYTLHPLAPKCNFDEGWSDCA